MKWFQNLFKRGNPAVVEPPTIDEVLADEVPTVASLELVQQSLMADAAALKQRRLLIQAQIDTLVAQERSNG